MIKTPRTDAVFTEPGITTRDAAYHRFVDLCRELEIELAAKNLEIEADDRNVNTLMDQVHELSNKLAAKDAECKAKVIEVLEEASEHVNFRKCRADFQHHEATHASCLLAIIALIEKRKGEGK